uniref:Uncharacterized protein n=1 Tax=Rhizochromulina marina TaxID=1034831 RepID=A0A7S2WB58_9STRA
MERHSRELADVVRRSHEGAVLYGGYRLWEEIMSHLAAPALFADECGDLTLDHLFSLISLASGYNLAALIHMYAQEVRERFHPSLMSSIMTSTLELEDPVLARDAFLFSCAAFQPGTTPPLQSSKDAKQLTAAVATYLQRWLQGPGIEDALDLPADTPSSLSTTAGAGQPLPEEASPPRLPSRGRSPGMGTTRLSAHSPHGRSQAGAETMARVDRGPRASGKDKLPPPPGRIPGGGSGSSNLRSGRGTPNAGSPIDVNSRRQRLRRRTKGGQGVEEPSEQSYEAEVPLAAQRRGAGSSRNRGTGWHPGRGVGSRRTEDEDDGSEAVVSDEGVNQGQGRQESATIGGGGGSSSMGGASVVTRTRRPRPRRSHGHGGVS